MKSNGACTRRRSIHIGSISPLMPSWHCPSRSLTTTAYLPLLRHPMNRDILLRDWSRTTTTSPIMTLPARFFCLQRSNGNSSSRSAGLVARLKLATASSRLRTYVATSSMRQLSIYIIWTLMFRIFRSQPFNGSFSAVSTLILATKYALESS